MSRTGWPTAVLALAASAAVGAVTLNSIADTRRGVLNRARLVTAREVEVAARTGASEWAPEAFADADGALRAALIVERQVEASLWPLPDFTDAHVHLQRAHDAARRAADTAVRRRLAAQSAAQAAIAAAADAVARHAPLAPTLAPHAARLASRAQLLLDQARAFLNEGEFSLAQAHAEDAHAAADKVAEAATAAVSRYADDALVRTWRRWVQETINWSRREARPAIVVSKADHRLTLYVSGRRFRQYNVDLSDNWVADKSHAGDGAVPEGRYHVAAKKGRGATKYYKALLLNYPNDGDRRAFAASKRDGRLAASAAIGGLIEIHGEGGRGEDWTLGCVALRNADLDQVFARAEVGTPITIVGSEDPRTVGDLARAAGLVGGP